MASSLAEPESLTPHDIIEMLRMQRNETEGGYLAVCYTSLLGTPGSSLPGFPPVEPERPLCGAIYYFLLEGDFSAIHRVRGDMLYHFYAGDPVEMLLLHEGDVTPRTEICLFSNDLR